MSTISSAQEIIKPSKDADSMSNDYYQYQLLPFVDDLIRDYGNLNDGYTWITLKSIPLPELVELTEVYLKSRKTVSASILEELIQERAYELYHTQFDGLRKVVDHVNGEVSYVR